MVCNLLYLILNVFFYYLFNYEMDKSEKYTVDVFYIEIIFYQKFKQAD
jgi:hypothetical protein